MNRLLTKGFVNALKKPELARNMSLLSALEQFPITFKVQPQAYVSAPLKQSTLSNGISITTKGRISPYVDLSITIASGSIYEGPNAKGCADYLKSIALVGTSNKSDIRLSRDLENLGADLTVTSDREYVTYHLKVLSDKLEPAFELIASTIVLPPKALYLVSEVKNVVELDYASYKADPVKHLDELVHEAAYGEASPYGSSFYAESVDSIDAEEVLKFRSQQFTSGNISIKANGISHEAVSALAECYFHQLPTGKSNKAKVEYVGGDLRVKADLGGATYAGLAFPIGSEGVVIFNALSKKVKSLGVPKGSLTPFHTSYSEGGLVGFFVGGDIATVNQALQAGVNELKALANDSSLDVSVKQASLESALIVDSLSSSLSSSNVTKEKTISAVKELLKSKPTFVVYGKTLGSPSYTTVQSWLK